MSNDVADFAKARASKLETRGVPLDEFGTRLAEQGYRHMAIVLIDSEGDPYICHAPLVDQYKVSDHLMIMGAMDRLKAQLNDEIE